MPRKSAVYTAIATALCLSVIGIALVYSASRRTFGLELAIRQSIWLSGGVLVAIVIRECSRSWLHRSTWFIYGGGILLLVATLFFGTTIRGDRSWLDLGLFNLQASEFMKVALVLAMARVSRYFSTREWSIGWVLLSLGSLFLAPFLLILAQPDLGTALVYVIILIGWLVVMGLWREAFALVVVSSAGVGGLFYGLVQPNWSPWGVDWLFSGPNLFQSVPVVGGVIVIGILVALVPYFRGRRIGLVSTGILGAVGLVLGSRGLHLLAGYQQQRLAVFLNPYESPLGSGYNIIQAQIAIGSGGWFGQGYLEGSQSQLGFIPELWTDFVFSVAVEELGLIAAGLLVLALLIYVYCFFASAVMAADWEGYYIASGLGLIAMAHVVLNLGVCVGLVPVVGLPLPFLSYGGSFLITNWLMLGLLMVVSRRLSGQALLKSPPDSGRLG